MPKGVIDMIELKEADRLAFAAHLRELEYSETTVRKYLHDLGVLYAWSEGQIEDRDKLNGFKNYLRERGYSASSVNTMLAAVNRFLAYLGSGWRLRYVKVQRRAFLPESRQLKEEEYRRLVRVAGKRGDRRLALLLQTICALGIRVSELSAVTVESLEAGQAVIQNKGKLRVILIPEELCVRLSAYCQSREIRRGPVFITRSGRPMDRSNIWKMMKRLSALARVAAAKAYPHNLRHLFARKYYRSYRDIVRLADILGHSSIDTTRIYTAGDGKEERRQLGQLRLLLD